jgi:hypothetical protein
LTALAVAALLALLQAPDATAIVSREDLLAGEWRCLTDCPAERVLAFALADGVRRFDARLGERAETIDARWTLEGPWLTVTRADATVLRARVVRLTAVVLELEIDDGREVPIYKRVERKD